MQQETERLFQALNERRSSTDFETRCRALEDIMKLAAFGKTEAIREKAFNHLQDVEGVSLAPGVMQLPNSPTGAGWKCGGAQ